jgi:outer membrane lipopolysaccharide assembly protein LptE/RlpB
MATGVLVLYCALSAGCGYRFAGGGSFPSGIKSVFVEIFENNTSETGIEQKFTNDLIYEITRNGSVNFTARESADGIISGIIVSSSTETVSPRGVTAASERRVAVRVDLKLTLSDGKVVWSAKGVTANEAYQVEPSNQQTEENKRQAINVISEELAESVLNRLTSDF